jgi:hypothetical protein
MSNAQAPRNDQAPNLNVAGGFWRAGWAWRLGDEMLAGLAPPGRQNDQVWGDLILFMNLRPQGWISRSVMNADL